MLYLGFAVWIGDYFVCCDVWFPVSDDLFVLIGCYRFRVLFDSSLLTLLLVGLWLCWFKGFDKLWLIL